ncbi:MAG: NTP transferase domain-containing protein [Oscillospiraceae bacterium]|nr:NTP transferase domain-containing protein [Oscillospiraceae bacterium]
MQKPTLVVMAAGMGSRFGGLKQVTPVGPRGECILEYSVFDALRAGFGRVVIVIKKAIEADFRQHIGSRFPPDLPVSYAFQEMDMLPPGFPVPEGREKPWGTGHAAICGGEAIAGADSGSYAVINADDFYGAGCFRLLAVFLEQPQQDPELHMAMVAYPLENTLTESGTVSRGICTVDSEGFLTSLVERTKIKLIGGRPMFTENDGGSWHPLPEACPVSMTCFGFPAGVTAHFRQEFAAFLANMPDPIRSEFYLPFAVDALVRSGAADMRVLQSPDHWYGMTYPGDREAVTAAIRGLVAAGEYPEALWSNLPLKTLSV